MVLPADDTNPVIKTVVGPVCAAVAAFFTYLTGRAHGKGKTDEDTEERRQWQKGVDAKLGEHSEILATHTSLHAGYVKMQESVQADVRTTRDTVNRIAGKLGVDGTK